MKRGILLLICLGLVFTMFLMPGIIAPYEEEGTDDSSSEGCTDSDGGVNFAVKGKLVDKAHNADYEDFCLNEAGEVVDAGYKLREHYCGEDNSQSPGRP